MTASSALLCPEGAIEHVIVIDLESESYTATFCPGSAAAHLKWTVCKRRWADTGDQDG